METGRKQVVIAGIETHVCVYQTAADLLAGPYEVEVVADAVSSRTQTDRDIGLRKIGQLGGRHTSVEMLLFELMRTARHPAFRDVPVGARIRFWLTGVFFHYLPPGMRRMLLSLYRKF